MRAKRQRIQHGYESPPLLRLALAGAALVCVCSAVPVFGQLRVVTYNSSNSAFETRLPREGADTVLGAIGDYSINGVVRPIDLLLLQEQFSLQPSTQGYVDILNSLHPDTTYARSQINGFTTGGGRPGLIYNTETLQLIDEQTVGVTSPNGAARQPLRYQLRPIGYTDESDFYVYVSHYKASTGASNELRRDAEARMIRNDADALGEDAKIIYAGDFNIRSSTEAMFQTLLAPGNGQAVDPLGITDWSLPAFRDTHTQSPTNASCNDGFLIEGGVDDRFDFQLLSTELASGEGLSHIENSYVAFGNNGSTFNRAINVGNTSGIPQNTLDALACVSDHLPVVADYQLPARLDATLQLPDRIVAGEFASLDLTVENIASVLTTNGADELDYTYTTRGDLFGAGNGVEFALGGGQTHSIGLDTSMSGIRSGAITVTTNSPGVPTRSLDLPINFTVEESSGATPCGVPIVPVSFEESFENGPQSPTSRYTLSQTFDDGQFDFFDRYQVPDTNNAARDDFGGFDGSYAILGQDHDGDGGAAVREIAINNIDISGKFQLEFSGRFGANLGEPNFQNFEVGDGMSIFASIDGGDRILMGSFAPNATGDSDLYLDTNGDGVGDGPRLTAEMTEFQFVVPDNGDSLDITIELSSNESFEVLAVDDLRLSGDTFSLPGDANEDGQVDDLDFNIWNEHRFEDTNQVWSDGDFNCDGFVDTSDFNVWNVHRGQSVSGFFSEAATNAVPEPSGLVMVWLGFGVVMLTRRKLNARATNK